MTVSRVINADGGVRDAMRAAVELAIATLDYRPNPAARQLASGAQCRIALLHANSSAAYLGAVLVGSLTEAGRAEAPLFVEPCDAAETARTIAARLLGRRIDGVVLPPPLSDDAALYKALGAAGLPCVLVANGSPPGDALAVAIDDRAAAAEMTAHLIGLGHRRIGFITGDRRQGVSARRLAGYRAALVADGVAFDPALMAAGDFSYRSGLVAGEQLLAMRWPPTAIFASNDDMAAAAIAAAHRRRLEMPRDLSVAGFDDTMIATTIWPGLATIRQPIEAMAEAAVALLIDAIRHRRAGEPVAAECRMFAHRLVPRGSIARRA